METKKSKPIKQYLSPTQIREIKADITSLVKMIEGEDRGSENQGTVGHFKWAMRGKPELQRELRMKENQLRQGIPVKVTGKEADRLYKIANKCKAWIQENMPRNNEIWHEYPKGVGTALQNGDFNRSVEKQIRFQLKGARIVDAYLHCMRRIDPENTDHQNMERLRRR